jgi:hypothetical protein
MLEVLDLAERDIGALAAALVEGDVQLLLQEEDTS